MATRKKKADSFEVFDQQKHALAMREARLSRALLVVYRYALKSDNCFNPKSDRELCVKVKRHAQSEIDDIKHSMCSCGCTCTCCGGEYDIHEHEEAVMACEEFLRADEVSRV